MRYALATGKRPAKKPCPLNSWARPTMPLTRGAHMLGSSPTSRLNKGEAGEAGPNACGRGLRRHRPPPAMPSTPAGSGDRDAPAKVRHDCWGGRMRVVHHPRRMEAAARLGHGAAAAERKKWSGGDMNDGGGDVMRR